MLNKVVLIGRLTKDVEYRSVSSGEVATFTLAVDRTFKGRNGERGTDFIPVVAWNKTAEICNKYLSKGRQTAVSGRIQTRTYEAQDGSRRYVTEVIAEEITLLGKKEENKNNKNNTREDMEAIWAEWAEEDDDAPF